jgi:hypothetical protein
MPNMENSAFLVTLSDRIQPTARVYIVRKGLRRRPSAMLFQAQPRGKLVDLRYFYSHWMNTMYRCAIAAIVAFTAAVPASAQLQRTFPQNTLRGAMVFGDFPQITLNGQATQLAPGSHVRNQDKMVVMASSLSGGRWLVNYTVDIGGAQVKDVWILRPDEAAVKPWPTTLEEAQTWIFDSSTQTWTKP